MDCVHLMLPRLLPIHNRHGEILSVVIYVVVLIQYIQLDKLVGLAMLVLASVVFLYYTTWTLLMVLKTPLS